MTVTMREGFWLGLGAVENAADGEGLASFVRDLGVGDRERAAERLRAVLRVAGVEA
jgi:hypothetical protein